MFGCECVCASADAAPVSVCVCRWGGAAGQCGGAGKCLLDGEAVGELWVTGVERFVVGEVPSCSWDMQRSVCICMREERRLESDLMWGKGECCSTREREAGRMQANRFLYLAGIKGVCVCACVGGWDCI